MKNVAIQRSSAPKRAHWQKAASPSRRQFLEMVVAAAAAMPQEAWAQGSSETPSRRVRVATGLLATWQSTAWLGAEAGLFKKRAIDVTLPSIAIGGPQAAAGLIGGDWEFAHTGTLPVAEEVLRGRDIVVAATPTSEFPNAFVMTGKEITDLAQLTGGLPSRRQGRTCPSSSARGSMRRSRPERSMRVPYQSICASWARFATAGMHFPCMSSERRQSSQPRAGSLLPTVRW